VEGLIVAGSFHSSCGTNNRNLCLFYKDYGQLPAIQPFLYGIKPAIIAIILGAIFPLAKKSLKQFN
jgi:chromate transporter